MSALGGGGPIAILVAAFLLTIFGTWQYRAFAIRRGIVASPNYRTLHHRPIPRGGGLVFSLVCLAVLTALAVTTPLDRVLARLLIAGGFAATVFGFIDDVTNVKALVKLVVQGVLAAWILASLGGRPVYDLPWTPEFVDLAISWLGLVWLMNLYNFIDGIDGLAASAAVMIGVIAIAVLVINSRAEPTVLLVFGLLTVCGLAFLVFNWPPASIFMGDAGSLFLGFCFGALLTSTVSVGQISIWTWAVIFGYFAGDTTTTTVLRMFLTDKWYGEHRSHAYQNLARLGSHLKVVRGIWAYQMLWLLPLAIWASRTPSTAPVAAALALVPVVCWTFRYGPRLSSS